MPNDEKFVFLLKFKWKYVCIYLERERASQLVSQSVSQFVKPVSWPVSLSISHSVSQPVSDK